ncbi:hypothetical protein D3C76_1139670 [compost metagenome]
MVPARGIDALAVKFDPGRPHLSCTTEHPAYPYALIQCQPGRLLADNHRVARHRHIEAADHQALILPALHQAFDHHLTHPAGEWQARVRPALGDFQLATGPLTTDKHFLRRRHPAPQFQALQTTAAIDRTDGASLLELRCPLDAAGHHFTTGVA